MSVEKLDFVQIRNEKKTFTTHLNSVLQNLKDAESLGVWAFLSSLPDNWTLNKKHLQNHFGLGRRKIERIMNHLSENNLIEYGQKRNSDGKMGEGYVLVKCGYEFTQDVAGKTDKKTFEDLERVEELPYVHNVQSDTMVSPDVQNRLSGNVQHTKETNKNKNIKKNIINIYSPPCLNPTEIFNTVFYKAYPRKVAPKKALAIFLRKKLHLQIDEITEDLEFRKENEWKEKDIQFIPHPSTYLSEERWLDEKVVILAKRNTNTCAGFLDFLGEQMYGKPSN